MFILGNILCSWDKAHSKYYLNLQMYLYTYSLRQALINCSLLEYADLLTLASSILSHILLYHIILCFLNSHLNCWLIWFVNIFPAIISLVSCRLRAYAVQLMLVFCTAYWFITCELITWTFSSYLLLSTYKPCDNRVFIV